MKSYQTKPSDLAMTEDEADQIEDYEKVKLLGYWYRVSDIETITWEDAKGKTREAKLFSQSNHSSWLDAKTHFVVLVDGTDLEVDILRGHPETDTEMVMQMLQCL